MSRFNDDDMNFVMKDNCNRYYFN